MLSVASCSLFVATMKVLHYITFALLVIGGLNWLLVGIFKWDIGMLLFGSQEAILSRIIYILVGLSAIAVAATHKKDCKVCSAEMPASGQTM